MGSVVSIRIFQRSSPEHCVRFGGNWLALALMPPLVWAAVDDSERLC